MTEREIKLAQVIWNYHHIDDELLKSDLILGLGSYDTRVASHCAELLAESWAPHCVFSGAEGNFTVGKWKKSEAETFADVAIHQCGANPEQIFLEPRATNTGDNVNFTKALCEREGIEVKTIIVASKPNMNRRGYATLLQYWPGLRRIICSAPETHFFESPAPGHSPRDVVCEIVGDIQRIIAYGKNGWQAPQDIPEEVMAAYQELIEAGFTDHLLSPDL